MAELSKAYAPGEVEETWYARWLEAGCFSADPASARPGYSIVIPPPNVTGILHLGHVLNNTIQDILARRARMKGFEVMWLPGTDHAGIATQNTVEKNLKKQGIIKHRDDLGREGLVEKIWEWKEKYGGIIIQQLKQLGVSCDWSRERFTLDPDYTRCVQRVFVDLYKKGQIYRGKRMVNWCPASLTALSDEEVIMKPQKGFMYYFKVQVVEDPDTWLTIATTRPETIPGDTAVAVNPKDERYAHLIGKHIRRPLPLENQAAIPIVGDEHVDFEFGTGVLKVTPAHDKADFEIGQRHQLEVIDVLHPNGVLNDLAGKDLTGLDRFDGRKKAAAMLKEMEVLEKEEPHSNNVGFSERADVPIEPRLSEQWFLKYPSVDKAKAVVASGEMKFYPDRWAKVYDHWMENIQDWCISRQLWWGHRIPVWTKKSLTINSDEVFLSIHHPDNPQTGVVTYNFPETNSEIVFTASAVHPRSDEWDLTALTDSKDGAAWLESHGFTQDPDVLDTWFSSWLWPFATMGWPEETPTLKKFYPTTDLVTGPDILFFWVARMIMAGYEWMGELPFKNVYFTGLIRDKQGRKMSKSLGNSPDPLDLIAKFGADALRFGIMRSAPLGLDLKFDESSVEEGRNFANKLWNACRYRIMQGGEVQAGEGSLSTDGVSVFALDIAAKLDQLSRDLEAAYQEYSFSQITGLLYDFFWGNYCDRFLEAAKTDFAPDADPAKKAGTLRVMDAVMRRLLIHLHPFMPHITEELWRTMDYGAEGTFLMQQPMPATGVLEGVDPALISAAQTQAAAVYESASRVRNLKIMCDLASNRTADFILKPVGPWVAPVSETLRLLAQAGTLTVEPDFKAGKGMAGTVTDCGEIFLLLGGLVDVDAVRARLTQERKKAEEEIVKAQAKLSSETFTARAPAEVVEEHRQRVTDFTARVAQLTELLNNLT
ncbi:MAG: valine--tRNA ligase [Verrucomicrobiota bacterium]